MKILFLLLYFVFYSPLFADNQTHTIKDIQDSLNKIKTMEAKMIQIDYNKNNASGMFYLSKPNKMKIEYKTNKTDIVMFASPQLITYYDKELDELSHIPTGSTPATLLMKENIDFNEFEILNFEQKNNIYSIKFHQKKKEDEGTFVFTFKYNEDFILQRIDKYDNENKNISIIFSNVKINQPIDEKIFIFKDKRLI